MKSWGLSDIWMKYVIVRGRGKREGSRKSGKSKSTKCISGLCSTWDTGLRNSLLTHGTPLKDFKIDGLLKSLNKVHRYSNQ